MKKISVVVPCHNVSIYLEKCMDHLIHQTIGMQNIEIILVDDASTDEGATWNRIMKYETMFPDTVIAIQLSENLRQGGARNVGISYAGAEYLMFCDADDWILLDAMECLYDKAKEYDADVIEYRMTRVDDNTDFSLLSTEEGEKSHLLELDTEEKRKAYLIISTPNCSLGCMRKLYRMSMIQDNHIQFAEHLAHQEPAFTLPVRLYEKRHYFLDRLLYFYYMSPDSTTRGNWENRKLDNVQVWETLVRDVKQRGLLEPYYDELSYIYFRWGYELSIRMILQRGYCLTADIIKRLRESLLGFFPDIRENSYVTRKREAFSLLLASLDMQLTEENVQVMNTAFQKQLVFRQ